MSRRVGRGPPPSPGSRALISVHPAPLLGGGRRAPSPPTHLHFESRIAIPLWRAPRVSFLGILARHTLPTQPCAGSITREKTRSLIPSTLYLLWKSHSGSSRFQSLWYGDQFIYRSKIQFFPPYKISDRSGFHSKNGMKNKDTFTQNVT